MTSCPACGSPLPQELPERCPAAFCGFPLSAPEADELRRIQERVNALQTEMKPLLDRREEIFRDVHQRDRSAPAPRRELDAHRIRALLLVLGASLLGIAALIFTVVSWGRLSLPAKAAVLTGLAAFALYLPWPLTRRRLTATGEAVSAVGLLLLILEGYAAYSYGLFDGVPGDWYTASFSLFLALVWTAYARYAPLRLPRSTSVIAVQLPLPLFALAYDDTAPYWTGGALIANAALTFLLIRRRSRLTSIAVTVAVLALGLATLADHGFTHLREPSEQMGIAPLLTAAAVVAYLWARETPFFGCLAALAAVLAVALPLQSLLPGAHLPTAFGLAALLLLLATVRSDRRHGTDALVRVTAWAVLAVFGLVSLFSLAAVLLGAETTAPGPTPLVLGVIAIGMATERIRPAATAFAALALAAVPPALEYGPHTGFSLWWQTALAASAIALAAVLRGAVAETLVALALAACLHDRLAGLALIFLLLTASAVKARGGGPSRLLFGVAAALWAGRLAHSAADHFAWSVPPEFSTVPIGVGGLLLGLAWRDRASSSWLSYGPGLLVLLGPSLLLLPRDGWVRPLLLGAAALAACLAGVRLRQQAPAVLGGLALLLDAGHQAAPYVRDVVTALPQWIPIAAAGLLLLSLGATYERRIRQAHQLYSRLSAMH